MSSDIKEQIEEIVNKIKNDKNIASKFQKDPSGTVKELTGLNIPADQLNKIVDGVKAKANLDKLGALTNLLGKK